MPAMSNNSISTPAISSRFDRIPLATTGRVSLRQAKTFATCVITMAVRHAVVERRYSGSEAVSDLPPAPPTRLEHQAIGRHRGDSFHDAEEQVRATEQPIVDQAIPLRARRPGA